MFLACQWWRDVVSVLRDQRKRVQASQGCFDRAMACHGHAAHHQGEGLNKKPGLSIVRIETATRADSAPRIFFRQRILRLVCQVFGSCALSEAVKPES